jgi:hypothetical protein
VTNALSLRDLVIGGNLSFDNERIGSFEVPLEQGNGVGDRMNPAPNA